MCKVKYIRKFIMVLFIQLMKDAILEIICDFKTVKLFFGVLVFSRAEILLGKILKKKSWRRSSYVISTKLYWGGK